MLPDDGLGGSLFIPTLPFEAGCSLFSAQQAFLSSIFDAVLGAAVYFLQSAQIQFICVHV